MRRAWCCGSLPRVGGRTRAVPDTDLFSLDGQEKAPRAVSELWRERHGSVSEIERERYGTVAQAERERYRPRRRPV